MSRPIGAALSCLVFASLGHASPEVSRLETQEVGASTYFLVALAPPKDLAMPEPPGITRVRDDHLEIFFFDAPAEGARRTALQSPSPGGGAARDATRPRTTSRGGTPGRRRCGSPGWSCAPRTPGCSASRAC